jgi:pimeloyl-ACP methyl ester carboxylesterase
MKLSLGVPQRASLLGANHLETATTLTTISELGWPGLLAFALLVTCFPNPGAGQTSAFESAPCPLEVPATLVEGVDISCGYVTVPERHQEPQGNQIRLAVATLRSTATEPAPEPLVLERGGPGESTLGNFIPALASALGERLRSRWDLVLVEQRGTFYSQPSLACPEWNREMTARLVLPLNAREERARDLESLRACHERLVGQGIDPSAFNSFENAADIPFVLTALGYDRFNLFGTSAGTLLAQHILRDYPDRLRSVILDSPLPLDARPYAEFVLGATQSLSRRFEACALDSGCR